MALTGGHRVTLQGSPQTGRHRSGDTTRSQECHARSHTGARPSAGPQRGRSRSNCEPKDGFALARKGSCDGEQGRVPRLRPRPVSDLSSPGPSREGGGRGLVPSGAPGDLGDPCLSSLSRPSPETKPPSPKSPWSRTSPPHPSRGPPASSRTPREPYAPHDPLPSARTGVKGTDTKPPWSLSSTRGTLPWVEGRQTPLAPGTGGPVRRAGGPRGFPRPGRRPVPTPTHNCRGHPLGGACH